MQTTYFKRGGSFNYLQIKVIWATCQEALVLFSLEPCRSTV